MTGEIFFTAQPDDQVRNQEIGALFLQLFELKYDHLELAFDMAGVNSDAHQWSLSVRRYYRHPDPDHAWAFTYVRTAWGLAGVLEKMVETLRTGEPVQSRPPSVCLLSNVGEVKFQPYTVMPRWIEWGPDGLPRTFELGFDSNVAFKRPVTGK